MVGVRDNLRLAVAAVTAYKLRAALTVLGLTMGVATLMTVMTLVQGANLYVKQKIANLGTNVFLLAKTSFAVVDFTVIVKSLKNKNIDIADFRAVAELCPACEKVGASASGTLSVQYGNKQTDDTSIFGYTPNIVDSTRARWISGATSLRAKTNMRRMSATSAPRWSISSFPTQIRLAASFAPGAWNSRSSAHFRNSVRCWAKIRTTS